MQTTDPLPACAAASGAACAAATATSLPVHQITLSLPVHQITLSPPVHEIAQSPPVHEIAQSPPVHEIAQSPPVHQIALSPTVRAIALSPTGEFAAVWISPQLAAATPGLLLQVEPLPLEPTTRQVYHHVHGVVAFLVTLRDAIDPRGATFRDLVAVLSYVCRPYVGGFCSPLHRRVWALMADTHTSAKFILRKLAAVILPKRRAAREVLMRTTLGLPLTVPCTENAWTKRHSVLILDAVCEHAPQLAHIPQNLRVRGCRSWLLK